LFSGSKKSRWSSDSVPRQRGADTATSSSIQQSESLTNSAVNNDCRVCLRVAIIVTPVLGLCVLVPIVVLAWRLLSGSGRRQARPRRRPLIVVPALRPTEGDKPHRVDICPFCGDPASLCLCPAAGNSSRMKFLVLTAAQPRRPPGGGYQQIVQPLTATAYPCRCCERNTDHDHDANDRTAFQLDADVDADFV